MSQPKNTQRAQSRVEPPFLADPDDPMRVVRSHLEKMEVGKSSGSCKVSFVTRLHRTAALQEYWCGSYEEAQVLENLAAHPEVVNIMEQFTRVDYVNGSGEDHHTKLDAHLLLRNGEEVLVSVKYDEKANRASYLAEIADIAAQCSRDIADRFIVVSRYSFHRNWRENAQKIYHARRGWDPEADAIVLEAANSLPEAFRFDDLVQKSGLKGRGWRAAVRLIGDGDLLKHPLDLIQDDTICRMAA